MADGVVGTQNRRMSRVAGLGCGRATRFWRMSRVEGMLRLEVGDFCACGDGES